MSATRAKSRSQDPGSTCRELCRLARERKLPRLLLLLPPSRGEDESWFGEQVLGAARRAAREADGLELFEVDGGSPDFDAGALEGFLAASSLFGGERALVLGRAGPALTKRPALAEQLVRAARDPAGPAWMVVQVTGGGKAHQAASAPGKAFSAAAKKDGVRLERFRRLYGDPPPWNPRPDGSEAAQFAAAEAKERGLKLAAGVAGLLVQVAGARPADLVQALEHFQMLGLEEVDAEVVREIAAHSAEGNAFEFAEALLSGDGAGALRLLARVRTRGLRTWDGRRLSPRDSFSLLVAIAAGERRKTAAVARGARDGLEFPEACKAAGVPAGGPMARKMQARLDACGEDRLERALHALRRAERRVKVEGWSDAGHALEELVFHMHASRRRA